MAKRDIDGIFLLDKPEGISSSAALVKTRAIFQAQKGGHTGALDPLASGLLPICLGEAAKFSSFFLEGNKKYIAEGTLGRTTTTCDREGEIVLEREVGNAMERLEEVLPSFIGKIEQTPPIYSAIKVDGKPLYKYARSGQEVEIPKRIIEIFELNLLRKTDNTFEIEVHCSKGTYIRTLVSDIGEALGCGAYVSKLHRTYVEGLPMNMMPLQELQALANQRTDRKDFSSLDCHLLPIKDALSNLKVVQLPFSLVKPLMHGMQIQGAKLKVLAEAHEVDLSLPQCQPYVEFVQIRYRDTFLGVGYFETDGSLTPKRMMQMKVFDTLLRKKNSEQTLS